MLLAEKAKGKIFFVSVTTGVSLVHAEGGTTPFTSLAKAIFGDPLHLVDDMVPELGQFQLLAFEKSGGKLGWLGWF